MAGRRLIVTEGWSLDDDTVKRQRSEVEYSTRHRMLICMVGEKSKLEELLAGHRDA